MMHPVVPLAVLLTLAACGPGSVDATTPPTWTWQADAPELAEKWLTTCNQGGPRPGICPTGSECQVQTHAAQGLADVYPVLKTRAWCVASADTLVMEAFPAARSDVYPVVVQLIDAEGAPMVPHVGDVTVIATEPDLHRADKSIVGDDGTLQLQLEAGDWHISFERLNTLNEAETLEAIHDPFPWGAPEGWLHVEGPGSVEVTVPTARLRLKADRANPYPPDTLTLTGPEVAVTLTPPSLKDNFETPPLGLGVWAATLNDATIATNTRIPLAAAEVRDARFAVARRTVEVEVDLPTEGSWSISYRAAFGIPGNAAMDHLFLSSRRGQPSRIQPIRVPLGRWDVWWQVTDDPRGVPGGWIRYASDIELPDRTMITFPDVDQALHLSWTDGATDRTPSLVKVFQDGSWSESSVATPRTWPGAGEAWLHGDCTEQMPGPLLSLGGPYNSDTTITADVDVAHVSIISAHDDSAAQGTVTRLDPATDQPITLSLFDPYPVETGSNPGPTCDYLEGTELVLFPGRYRFERGAAQWIVEVTGSTTLDLSTMPVSGLAFGTDGVMLPDLTSADDFGEIVVRHPFYYYAEERYSLPVVGSPRASTDSWDTASVLWRCDAAAGCTAGTTEVETLLVDRLVLTRKAAP